MNLNYDLFIGRESYRAFPRDVLVNYLTNNTTFNTQENALSRASKSDTSETKNVATDLERFIDSDPLTKEEISDLYESYNDLYLNKGRSISGELDAKSIVDKILEFADDE